MITRNGTFYHLNMTTKPPDHCRIIDKYLRIGNYRFIIRGDSKRNTFYDI